MALSFTDYKGNRAGAELKQFRRDFPFMITRAIQQVIMEWQEKKAPKHFTRQAFYSYSELKGSYKRKYSKGRKKYSSGALRMLVKRIEEGKDTPEPMTKSGQLKAQFLGGSIRFSGGKRSGNVTAQWLSLPRKPLLRRGNQINVAEALTEIPPRDEEWFEKRFDFYLQQNINKHETAIFGGIAVVSA